VQLLARLDVYCWYGHTQAGTRGMRLGTRINPGTLSTRTNANSTDNLILFPSLWLSGMGF